MLLIDGTGALADKFNASRTFGTTGRSGDRNLLRNGAATGGFGNRMQIAPDGSLSTLAFNGTWWAYTGSTWVQQPGAPAGL